ncbi:MAG: LPS export ABC transporter permease LptG [Burkholderiaceae bacterium]|nr:LPS export ABC transporter permease LptG [Burkholderiaceae bacterium]
MKGSIAFRYIGRSVAYFTLLTLTAFIALFFFFNTLDELERVGRGTYTVSKMLIYVLLQIPGHIAELAPVATLIGGIVALASLAAGSEITILRMAGLSTGKLVFWVVLMSLPFSTAIFVFSDYITPAAERTANALRLQALQIGISSELVSGSWVKDSQVDTASGELNTVYVNATKLEAEGFLKDLKLYEFDFKDRLKRVVVAERADAVSDGWILKNVNETVYQSVQGPLGETVEARNNKLGEWHWKTAVTPSVIGAVARAPNQMNTVELYRISRFLSANGQGAAKLQLVLFQNLFMPLSIAVMLLLALPFAFLHTRAGGVSTKIFAGIMLGILFFMLDRLFSHLGILNTWPAFASAIAPSLIGLSVALGLLWWAQRAR